MNDFLPFTVYVESHIWKKRKRKTKKKKKNLLSTVVWHLCAAHL